jgi:hypothetical protein
MIQNVLSDIGGIGLYGVVSVCLFFAVFTGVIVRSCLMGRRTAERLGALPLDDGAPVAPKGAPDHE